jgi:hypothetical protein
MVSPTYYNMIRDDIRPDTARLENGIKTINLGEIKFHKIDLNSRFLNF